MVDSVKLLSATNAYNAAKNQQMDPLAPDASGGKESAFAAMVGESIGQAATTIGAGETTAIKALVNEASMAELATAVTDAELTLRTVVAVRDRIISAYQDIIKMPI